MFVRIQFDSCWRFYPQKQINVQVPDVTSPLVPPPHPCLCHIAASPISKMAVTPSMHQVFCTAYSSLYTSPRSAYGSCKSLHTAYSSLYTPLHSAYCLQLTHITANCLQLTTQCVVYSEVVCRIQNVECSVLSLPSASDWPHSPTTSGHQPHPWNCLLYCIIHSVYV